MEASEVIRPFQTWKWLDLASDILECWRSGSRVTCRLKYDNILEKLAQVALCGYAYTILQ